MAHLHPKPAQLDVRAAPVLRRIKERLEDVQGLLEVDLRELNGDLEDVDLRTMNAIVDGYLRDLKTELFSHVEDAINTEAGRKDAALFGEERSDYDEHNTHTGGLHAHGMWAAE